MSTVNSISNKRTGRRSGSPDTKGRILNAAQALFATKGLDQTTMRQIAAKAGVDPALIVHYFKNKHQLFMESMHALLYAQERELLEKALGNSRPQDRGSRLARAFIGFMSDDASRTLLLSVMRSATSDEKAAEIMREFVIKSLLDEIEKYVVGSDRRLRATLVGSQLLGVFMARYIVKVEPLASATPDDIVKYLGPRLQSHFD